MKSKLLLLILLSVEFIYSQVTNVPLLKFSNDTNLISLEKKDDSKFYKFPSGIEDSQSLVFQLFSADTAFNKIQIQLGSIEEIKGEQIEGEEQSKTPTYSFKNATNPSCTIKKSNHKCLWNVNLKQITAVNFICVESPCTANIKTYPITPVEINEQREKEELTYQQDIILVKYNLRKQNPLRTVIETRLLTSLKSKANDTTVQYFYTQQFKERRFNTKVIGDTHLSYIEYPDQSDTTYSFFAIYSGLIDTSIIIKCKTYAGSEMLLPGKTYTDYFTASYFSKNLAYQLQFENYQEYDYIKFIFKWYELKQGEVTLVASCNYNEAYSDSFWYSTLKPTIESEKIDEDSSVNKQYSLIISQPTATKINTSNNSQFYFGLNSQVDSGFFKLDVVVSKKTYPEIKQDEMLAGKIRSDDIINIIVNVPYSTEEQLTVVSRNSIGGSTIYLRECKSTDCIQEAFTQENKDKMGSKVSRLENDYATKNIAFIPNCSSQKETCQYMIGVIPTTQNQISDYIVEVFSSVVNKSLTLLENKVYESQININEYQFFALYIDKIDDIKSISVKISSPHVQLYVSNDNQCMKPTPECTKSKVLFKGLNTKPVVLTGNNAQRGVVFVGVYSFTATIYSLVVEIDRVDQKLITQVQSGALYYGQLSKDKRIQYFIFDPSLQVDKQDQSKYDFQDIEINVRGAKDKIVIMVNNDGTMPYDDKNGFMWSSNNGILFISKTDPQFKKDAVYKICLMATEHAFELLPTVMDTIQSSNDLQYQMLITSDAHTKVLEVGNTIQDQLESKDSKMYQIHLENSGFQYIISTHSNDHIDKKLDILMKVGSQPYDITESFDLNYNFSESQFTLKPEVINEKLCKGKKSCNVYIAMQSKMNLIISYSLTVWNKNFAIELKEGIQYQTGIHHIDGSNNFYFYPSNKDHPLNIFLSSIYGHTGFNVLIFQNSERLPPLQWKFPTSSKPEDVIKYHFTSGVHNSHSINFQTQALDNCWPDCVILISVSYYQGLPNDGSNHTVDEINTVIDSLDESRLNDKFTILVSTIYSDLHFNQQLEFTIENQESKFFYLSLNNIIAEKDSIQIEMTSLSGKAVIGAMIKDDIHNRYPSYTGSQQDFVSYSNYLEVPFKRLNSTMTKKQISKDQNPQLIIEVTCVSQSAGKFVLVAMQGNSTAIDLMHGLPQEVYLKPNKMKYYKYFHFSDSDFSIKVSREIGFPDLSLRVCKKSKTSSYADFKKCFETVKPVIQEQHTAGESSSTISIPRNNTALYCQNCLYIIGLSNEQEAETHAFINILLQQDFTWLQEGRQIIDTVDKNGINLYRLSVDSDEETFITLQQYTGEVELYYSYRYSYLLKDYIGPIKVNLNDKFIHKTLRPRQDFEDNDDFNTFNKPNQVPIVNKNNESKKNNEDNPASENVQFDDLSEFFYEAEIFLCVKNIDKRGISSDYSLVFNAGDEYRFIYDGQIMGSSIPPNKKITYLYHHFEYEAPARLNIFSHSKFFSMENHLKVVGFHDLQKNRLDYKDVTKEPISLEMIASHEFSQSYKLPERNGTYELIFSNEHETKTLNISLSINARDMLLVPLTQQIEHALTPQSINYYETIAPKQGFITLTITHCTGEFELGISSKYDEFLERSYDLNFKSHPGSTNVYSFKVKKGPVYFAVRSSLEESFYKIRPDFFTLEKYIPHNNIVPGNEGVIYHKRKMGGQTEIIFTPVTCATCSSEVLSKSRVQYDIIYSTDIEFLNVLGKCSASNYFDHEAKNQLHFKNSIDAKDVLKTNNLKQKTVYFDLKYTEDIKFVINLDNDEEVYYISVVASITNIPNKDLKDLKVFYENSQIGKVQVYVQGEASVYAFLFACILIMVFFCMTTCLFWRRYKTMQQGLEVSHKWRDVEMQQEKRKQLFAQKNNSSNNIDETTQVNVSSRGNNIDDSFSDRPFENPDLYVPSDNDLRSHFKSESPAPKQEENPFDKISIKINPPPSAVKTTTKQGYDQFIDEN